MTRRAISALTCIAMLALAVPGLGWAAGGAGASGPGGSGSGGNGSGGNGGGPSGGSGLDPGKGRAAQPANQSVSSSANGITITASQSAFLARQLVFHGTVSRAAAGDVVQIERLGRDTRGVWTLTTQATVQRDGSFAATWNANRIGRFAVRAVLSRPHGAAAAGDWPTVTVTVYRPATATQYGPGFFGKRTACGKVLRRSTLGVANRTLPCGTPVGIYYRGRMIVVRVIDRGPYAHGVDWDLTTATGRALGIPGTARIGAVSLRRSS